MLFPQIQPFIELSGSNGKTFAQFLDRIQVHEIFTKDAEDKEQTVGTVRDDEIRKNGMGRATAVAGAAEDSDLMPYTFSTDKVDQISFIVTVDMEIPGGTTDRTGLKFRSYKGHELLKQRF